ncbi:MAG: type II toxin-antitoxin system RelE/ParE family toxin [Ignavibacteriae bacterium]|nr:type II toxin-antitoxin system RelE/ParE family toxin [Ignavibacteriota bacterium]
MSGYKLLYKKPVAKEIQRLPKQIQKRLKLKLEWFISQTDPLQFAEPLTKPADAQYRFRVGNYRILFDVESQNIVILHIQHRKDVYRK